MTDRVQDLGKQLDIGSEGVRMVGIWGVGGGGKTTLASTVYMKISQLFQGHCIVENVREKTNKDGLNKLQGNILSALSKTKVKVYSIVQGKEMMKRMLCHRKVLLLLDDVDTVDQLEALAGKPDWFGNGSRIIITTRDEHLLKTHKVDYVYPVRLLSNDDAVRLFKIHAYNEKDSIEDYKTLSLQLVSHASGLPLSLKVLGSFLYDKNKKEWIDALKKLKEIPNKKVMDILKVSYDALEPDQKELFLNIACFWKGRVISNVMEILKACGFYYEIGIKVLIQKALITIVDYDYGESFDVHDTIQEMGHYIVRGKHLKNPEKHRRIWKNEDIEEMCFVNGIIENDTIEAIQHIDTIERDYPLPICNFISSMKRLRWIEMYTATEGEVNGNIYLSNELQYFHLELYGIRSPLMMSSLLMKLVVLKLNGSMQEELWEGCQCLPHLNMLELKGMKKLRMTPDFNGLPRLQRLKLNDCEELEEIHISLDNRTSLEYLELSYCQMLKRFPSFSRMKNMKNLHIVSCSLKDGEMPHGIGELSNLQELNLSLNDNFTRLNFSLSQLTQLKSLDLSSCDELLELPELPTSLAILTTLWCVSLTLVKDFYKNCKELCQVSLEYRGEWSTEGLLQSMLEGNAIENGCMHLVFKGDFEIAKTFIYPFVGGESSYKLELPENWYNDFSGFLICVVLPTLPALPPIFMASIRGVSGEESVRDRSSSVWFVSFAALRHTAWWDQTYNAISFNMVDDTLYFPSGFAVRLIEKKSEGCLTESSTDSSSPYTPKIKIRHDSKSELMVYLSPHNNKHALESTFKLLGTNNIIR